jgi:1,4-dihydroxy-2-naphthoate octaprenyltransferase
LPAAVAPVLVGTALAWHAASFDPWAAAICLGFAMLIQIGTNFANDYYDFVKGADTAARVGPRRAVASGLVTPATMRNAMATVFVAAFLLGLSLVAWGGPWLIAIGVASVLCGFAYTGGPYPLGYHGWGDVFVFFFFGLVAVGATYFVQAGWPPVLVWLLAVPVGLLATNILVANNYRDSETDAMAGKRTLVVRFGRGFARAQFGCSLLIAFGLVPVAAWHLGGAWWLLLPWLLLPEAWRQWQGLRESKTPGELIELLGASGRLLALYAVLLAAGLILAAR